MSPGDAILIALLVLVCCASVSCLIKLTYLWIRRARRPRSSLRIYSTVPIIWTTNSANNAFPKEPQA